MPLLKPAMGYLLRRAAFGVSPADAPVWSARSLSAAVARLVDYDAIPEDVNAKIGTPGFLSTVSAAAYPETELGATLQLVAAAIASEVGSTVFWVQTDGYDTHAAQGTIAGLYAKPLTILNDALLAFHDDLQDRGLLDNTLILQFSEFGRRIDENGSQGTDHGAASLMTAIGGAVRGGIYGTAARSLADIAENPDLENGARDVTYATDCRSVYARVIDHWLDADSVPILLGDYRNPAVAFI